MSILTYFMEKEWKQIKTLIIFLINLRKYWNSFE